ncbi:hypothetical protein BC832DRAFT_321041 [Gaertneriomyces semiglobifer]|nr:hypothetical protein BC832DRAFT_321041 [Gaertneriomyces semiglobifer]
MTSEPFPKRQRLKRKRESSADCTQQSHHGGSDEVSTTEGRYQIEVAHRRCKLETLRKKYPGCTIIDVTSKAALPWRKFSPFYPHKGIPVATDNEKLGTTVEGIWQGLKCFANESTDASRLQIDNMKGLKRSATAARGRILGHSRTFAGERPLLSYLDARKQIYLPAYLHVLRTLQEEVQELQALARKGPLILLDYTTNTDVEDCSKPLSHAGLVKAYLEGNLT